MGLLFHSSAGYRPATFSNVRQDYDGDGALPTYYPPAELGKEWELSDSAKWLWRAAERKPWSPATHAAFPPAFREAARALLLAAHRAHGRDGATTLGVLPPALQLSILGQAAYPLSAWSPCMEDCSALRLVQRRAEEHDRRVARAKARRKQKGKGTPSA